MLRLFKLLLSCVMLAVFAWFAVTVQVGKFTLWDHARRIAGTDEARDLADGAKGKAQDMAREICQRIDCKRPFNKP